MIREYYQLAKPGIVFGNAVTAVGGFALASKGHIDPWLLIATLFGISFIVGASCVFNNYMDRMADAKMSRTQKRPLVTGTISTQKALLFGSLLTFLGGATLALFANLLSLALALIGMAVYLGLYTVLKYRTAHCTLVGSIAGGIPPMVGYCAVSGRIDMGALLIFLILVLWQMPHFFAIAMYRADEFAAASIQVLPITRGVHVAKVQMLLYVAAFLIAATLLTFFGYTGFIYLAAAFLCGFAWLWLAIQGFKVENEKKWARKMFVLSLQVITLLSVMIAIDVI